MTSPRPSGDQPQYTGRSILVMEPAAHPDEESMVRTVRSFTGTSSIASASDFGHHAMTMEEVGDEDATLFPNMALAVVPGDGDRVAALQNAAATDARIRSVEPEQVMFALSAPPDAPGGAASDHQLEQYLRGYRDASAALLASLERGTLGDLAVSIPTQEAPAPPAATAPAAPAAVFADTDAFSWGLRATRVDSSPWTGEGIRVAVLDTGIDFAHPDVIGRRVFNQSFVPGEEVQDGHGHGTHTAGTAAGPRVPPSGARRYGVAGSAALYVGKVLGDTGSGADSQILAGMEWAIAQRCQVISMSLGSNDPTVSAAYEAAGQSALQNGCLIVAAAGNNARRQLGNVGFVGRPANSESIVAVGAVDADLAIGWFSARTGRAPGGQVDIAGPGLAVFSSWPLPTTFKSDDGTSMACPHVAGIAALHSQATGDTGMALWGRLVRGGRQLALPSLDVGSGLVQAPQ